MPALINQAQDLVNDAAIVHEQRCQHAAGAGSLILTVGLPSLPEVKCRQTQPRDVGLSVRFDEHVAINFA